MSISCRGPVSPSTPTYGNMNVTETMGNPIKNGCKNLYLQPKVFKTTLKPNSYLPLNFRCSLWNPSSPTFLNITKTMTNLSVVKKISEKGCNALSLLSLVFHRNSNSNSHLMSISHRSKSVNPSSSQYQPDTGNVKFSFRAEAMTNRLVAWKFNKKFLK